jgi:prepilin peptidase CpaA
MNVASNLTLLGIIIVASVFDIKERRIPNWVIVFGLIAGLVLGSLQGSTQLILSIGGFCAGIAALLLPFAFGWMGAGDVKLFAVVGALLGYTKLPRIFFFSCLVAGILALSALALGYARQKSIKQFWSDCKFMILTFGTRLPQRLPLDTDTYSVPWGVAIGAGTIMAYYLDPSGTWAGF